MERKNCPVYLLCDSFYMDKIYAPKTYKGEMNYDFYGMNYDATSISIYPDSFPAIHILTPAGIILCVISMANFLLTPGGSNTSKNSGKAFAER